MKTFDDETFETFLLFFPLIYHSMRLSMKIFVSLPFLISDRQFTVDSLQKTRWQGRLKESLLSVHYLTTNEMIHPSRCIQLIPAKCIPFRSVLSPVRKIEIFLHNLDLPFSSCSTVIALVICQWNASIFSVGKNQEVKYNFRSTDCSTFLKRFFFIDDRAFDWRMTLNNPLMWSKLNYILTVKNLQSDCEYDRNVLNSRPLFLILFFSWIFHVSSIGVFTVNTVTVSLSHQYQIRLR